MRLSVVHDRCIAAKRIGSVGGLRWEVYETHRPRRDEQCDGLAESRRQMFSAPLGIPIKLVIQHTFLLCDLLTCPVLNLSSDNCDE
jgi:hypothetical protein